MKSAKTQHFAIRIIKMKSGNYHHVTVTRDHIIKGVPRNCDRCAISLAMNEHFTNFIHENGFRDWRAETVTSICGFQVTYVSIKNLDKQKTTPSIRFSNEMEVWMDVFDSGTDDSVLTGQDITDPITIIVDTKELKATMAVTKPPDKNQASIWDLITGGE